MLDIKAIKKTMERCEASGDVEAARRAALYGAMILAAAGISKDYAEAFGEPSKDEVAKAWSGAVPLLSSRPVTIDPGALEKALRGMAEVFISRADCPPELVEAAKGVDWAFFAAAELASLASRDPLSYLLRVEEATRGLAEDLGAVFVVPVAGYALRGFLDGFASRASEIAAGLESDTIHAEAPLKCPVCGVGIVEMRRLGDLEKTLDHVAEEVPVALVYNGISHAVMMATPKMLEEFATGFTLSEGIVPDASHICSVEAFEEEGSRVEIEISFEIFAALKTRRRAMVGRTGCGICGKESLECALGSVPRVPRTKTFDMARYREALLRLYEEGIVGRLTGCAHLALLTDSRGGASRLGRGRGAPRRPRQAPRSPLHEEDGGERTLCQLPRLIRNGAEGCLLRDRDYVRGVGADFARDPLREGRRYDSCRFLPPRRGKHLHA